MEAQTPAEGVLKVGEYGTSKHYYIRCECGSDECAHQLEVEADEIELQVHVYVTAHSKWWEKKRWKQVWHLLTKGYVEMQATAVLSEQTAINYANTLTNAVKDVKVLRDKYLAERKKK